MDANTHIDINASGLTYTSEKTWKEKGKKKTKSEDSLKRKWKKKKEEYIDKSELFFQTLEQAKVTS